jgi:hypothetical protein
LKAPGKEELDKAIGLYSELIELRKGIIDLNTTKDFEIQARDSWVRAPINEDTARAFCNSHYSKRISELETQLTNLGFNPA